MTDEPKVPELDSCDVVMKGGITSGVVYPSAVLALSERYRFCSIGGASVGAIAAAVTAAAEYGRQMPGGKGFAQLDEMNEEVARKGFLLSLFKPRPAARGLYAIYLAVIGKRGTVPRIRAVLARVPWVILPLFAWWLALAFAGRSFDRPWWTMPIVVGAWGLLGAVFVWIVARQISWAGVIVGFALPLAWPLALGLLGIGLRGWRDLDHNGFGLVPGSSDEGALCDWLHRHVQKAAGLGADEPLTFGMLRRAGVELQMITTNLSLSRPMRVPQELEGYAFHPKDLREALPPKVLQWLEDHGERDGTLVRFPPADDVPVLVGFRFSLSFPLLFTALRLWAPVVERATPEYEEHWFSDGGIGSNFPVHFFDSWVPTRPTFALSFAPFAVDDKGDPVSEKDDIGLPPPATEIRRPRWVRVDGVVGFFGQILDTMQNWRDTMQSELPGFRDRVYETRLNKKKGQGGLNLGMDEQTIGRLQDRGRRVGQAIIGDFKWNQHVFTRYLVAMEQLELGLLGGGGTASGRSVTGLRKAIENRVDDFERGDVGADELYGRDKAWLPPAGRGTWNMVDMAERWAQFGGYVGDKPVPRPVMRVVPDV